ncbi:MAG: hypothetical protein K0S86_3451 [Geminicoccaceae bacterium]|jgi:hypothetical protein|nr:hypothetical protein [Geminicoccaceae bacterium]
MTTPITPTSPNVAPPVTGVPRLGPGDTHDGFFLWGAPKAGKSGFIGALYGLSRGQDAERWTAHPKDCDDPHTQEMVLRAHEELRERRNTKTGVRDTPYRPLRLTLRKMKAGRQVGELRVALVDPAGEFSIDPSYRLSTAGKNLYRQVATSHGALWLFEATPDGAASTLDRLLILEQLVALIDAGGAPQLDLPVAICLSKIDCLSPERREAALANPTQALLDHLGATSLTWFEAVCPTLKCFAVSSAGVVPDKVRPIGLNEVLDWLEEQRTRRVRAAHAAALRGRAVDLVKRWSGRALRGTAMVAILAGAAYGGVRVAKTLQQPTTSTASATDSIATEPRTSRTRADTSGPSTARRRTSSPQTARPRTANGAAPRPRESAGDVARRSARPTPVFNARAERDSMRAAFEEAMAVRREGESGARWFRRAYVHASRLIDRGKAGSREYTPERLIRARACLLGELDCPRTTVSEDLTWVLVYGDDAQRRTAVRLLERIGT